MSDYVVLLLSIGLAALRKPFVVLRVALPYLVLLILFAGFVAWNGSVVLGISICSPQVPSANLL